MDDQRTYKIIGAAMEVHKELGCGFLEAVYQEALGREFNLLRIPNNAQPIIDIRYKGVPLEKKYQPDFICYDEVIVEIKSKPFLRCLVLRKLKS
jgi:GxxExxY protein